jgi:hypothetical protein
LPVRFPEKEVRQQNQVLLVDVGVFLFQQKKKTTPNGPEKILWGDPQSCVPSNVRSNGFIVTQADLTLVARPKTKKKERSAVSNRSITRENISCVFL